MLTPRSGTQWGLLGGTFDPVHNGHLALASGIHARQHLTGILLVPSFRHPFKGHQCQASFDDRVEMLRRATDGYDYLLISEIEKKLGLSGRTLDTIIAVKKRYRGTAFCFIIGADNLSRLKEWYEPEKLLAEVKLLAGARPHFRLSRDAADGLPDNVDLEIIETPLVDVSSTDIREKLRRNPSDPEIARLIPPAVHEYIKSRKLYT